MDKRFMGDVTQEGNIKVAEIRFLYNNFYFNSMPSFLARKKKTKTRRPVSFENDDGDVSFTARRKPKRRYRVEF